MRLFAFLGFLLTSSVAAATGNLAEPQCQLTGGNYSNEAACIMTNFYNIASAVQAQNQTNTTVSNTYLPLSGGTVSGNLTVQGATAHGAAGNIPGIGFSSFVYITTTMTWTTPAGVNLIYVQCWGAGGGGAISGCGAGGGQGEAGNGGDYGAVIIQNPAASYTVTIATGGITGNPASSGCTTFFGGSNATCFSATNPVMSVPGGSGANTNSSGQCTYPNTNNAAVSGATFSILGGIGGPPYNDYGGSISGGSPGGQAPFGGANGAIPGGGGGDSAGVKPQGAAGACLIWY